jgi:hypothetical protein
MSGFKLKKIGISMAMAGMILAVNLKPANALSISTNPISFGTIQLNGSEQVIAGSTAAWQADATDETGGWNVMISAGDFVNTDGKTIPVDQMQIKLEDMQIQRVSGDETGPVSTQTTFVSLSSTPLKLLSSAESTGNGSYTFTPEFELSVPPETYSGNYSVTITVQINAGP